MTGPAAGPARISRAQAVGWGITLAVVLALVILFFLNADAVRPVLILTALETPWPVI